MDFIPLASAPDLSWAIPTAIVALVMLVVGYLLINSGFSDAVAFFGLVLALLGLFGMAVCVTVSAIEFNVRNEAGRERSAAIIEEVKDVYGIKLRTADYAALGFPRTEPEEDFVAYGTISETTQVGDKFERHDITLVWAHGKLILAGSVDGEEFTPLEVR